MEKGIIKNLVARLAREEYGKMIALLIKQFKDIDIAEESLQEAMIIALTKWEAGHIPLNPVAWLLQVARRKAIDKIRRSSNYRHKQTQLVVLAEIERLLDADTREEVNSEQLIEDERLRLIFTCCHPGLEKSVQVALTLNTLCGFSAEKIARAFLVSKQAMSQRLVRAKKKIRLANIPYKIPNADEIEERLEPVLSVVYLIFNEGYYSTANDDLVQKELSLEAIRLAKLINQLITGKAEVIGLLALMHFHYSRYIARISNTGEVISMNDQDRKLWSKSYIAKGDGYLKLALSIKELGSYQIQAAISAVHAQAKNYQNTDWEQIVLLYEKLQEYEPSLIVELNKAVAISYAYSLEEGLMALKSIEGEKLMMEYQPLYAAKADMYKRMNLNQKAKRYYIKAIELSNNEKEISFLNSQLLKITESV